MKINPSRIRKLNDLPIKNGPVIYWMNRDMRASDNWALLHARQIAGELKQPLFVVFNLEGNFLGGGLRQFRFKTDGLQELEINLRSKNIPFIVTARNIAKEHNDTPSDLLKIFKAFSPGAVITDFCPLNICKSWIKSITPSLKTAFFQVDAHNIVPCWIASPKKEFGAYTIRPKIHRLLPEFLEDFPAVKKQSSSLLSKYKEIIKKHRNDWDAIITTCGTGRFAPDKDVKPVSWITPGEKSALKAMRSFLENGLARYDADRNDPNKNGCSNLSPYLHYGHLSAQRLALETQKHDKHVSSQESFLEELIVRRELSDNYCHYETDYDNPKGFPDWARKTLNAHMEDPRDYLYSKKDFENAATHDELWNAAQNQMRLTGKMHGYMRMYWAKKILEWSPSPLEAQKTAIYLNDKYELDGRDPNGYAGIAWSIGGLHDRAWGEREIFGKIRYMSFNGCKSKFDVNKYIAAYSAPQ